jgi:hypothetical protein
MTKDTRPEWEIAREVRETERNVAAGNLLPSQRIALLHAMKTIMSCDSELHEMFELTVDSMKSIDSSEWKLRTQFPELYAEIVAELTCTCED